MQKLPSKLTDRIEALQSCRYFVGVGLAVLHQLAHETHLRRYEPGEVLFWEGAECAGLHIIRQGSVKLFKISPQGRQMVVRVFDAGESFNEAPVFDEGANPVNAAAVTVCEVWLTDCAAIRAAIVQYPEMAQPIILNLTANLRMLVGLVEELSFYQVTNRLARLISQLPEGLLLGEGDLRLTQDEIAARLGTVREVVGRSLKELERSGALHVKRGRIQVVDEQILKMWAQLPED